MKRLPSENYCVELANDAQKQTAEEVSVETKTASIAGGRLYSGGSRSLEQFAVSPVK
jgi:hypothetical protein